MTEVLAFLDAGIPVAVPGGGDRLRAIAEAALQLKAGQRTSHPELFLVDTHGAEQARSAYVQDCAASGLDLAASPSEMVTFIVITPVLGDAVLMLNSKIKG